MAGGGSAVAGGKDVNVTSGIRIVVAGDPKTGKSSLILTAFTKSFPANVAPVLPPLVLPDSSYPDGIPITIIDTSSSLENRDKVIEELKRADAIILTYGCDKPDTLDRLSTFWLPELQRSKVMVPVIVVGCMLDKSDNQHPVSLEEVMSPLMDQFPEIETCIECSAFKQIQMRDVFNSAKKAVLHPTAPLFDHKTYNLTPQLVKALKRIFLLCDQDKDGALSNTELNDFQMKCFNTGLEGLELERIKKVVQEKCHEGVNERGLTFSGFLFLQALFIEKGSIESTWAVLKKFGYNNEIRLNDNCLLPPTKRHLDQSVELTNEALDFLRKTFSTYDVDGDGALSENEIEDLFSTAPDNPWNEAPYKNSVEKDVHGGVSLDNFLSQWALMTLVDPYRSVEYLIYIGYTGEPLSAIQITRRRRTDRKKKHSDRNVYQCYVFGPKNAGKSTLLNSFIKRPFLEDYVPTTGDNYAVNVVQKPDGSKKTLVLREIPEGGVEKLLSMREALVACDVAIFVYDSSRQPSWNRASELLINFTSHIEATGYDIPCLIVAAKDDINKYFTKLHHSTKASKEMGTEAPIRISTKLGEFSNIFERILNAAQHPHLSIPRTEAGKREKYFYFCINLSLKLGLVGAVAMVGMALGRVYVARNLK